MRSNYYIIFRISNRTIGGKTYKDRRRLLVENARKENKGFWDETTSYILMESDLSTSGLAERACEGLSAEYDLVLVYDAADLSAYSFGDLKNFVVMQSFFPKLKKLQ